MTDKTTQASELCDDCISGHLKYGTPTGAEIKLGGVDAYVATPGGGKKPTAAVLILHDAFGWTLVNNRLLADEIAKEGYLCLLPDLFEGEIIPFDTLSTPGAPKKYSPPVFTDAVYKAIARHNPTVVLPLLDRVLDDLREQYPSVRKIGATGYCWGGRYSIFMGGKPDRIAAVVISHPSLVQVEEVQPIAVPSLWCNAEKDLAFGGELRVKCEEIVRGKEVETSWIDYEGTSHGFTTRCDETNIKEQKAATKALNDLKAFFSKYLTVESTAHL